jgi:hypothetical protein
LKKINASARVEGIVGFPLFCGCIAMLIYMSFTAVWTLVIVCHAATARRIHYRMINPIERRLGVYGVPGLLQSGITGLLRWSIIPLGFLWACGLVLTAFPD